MKGEKGRLGASAFSRKREADVFVSTMLAAQYEDNEEASRQQSKAMARLVEGESCPSQRNLADLLQEGIGPAEDPV